VTDDVLDEAYVRLAATAPEYRRGLSNHGPMAAEALVQLGRADAVHGWLDRYLEQLDPAPMRRPRPPAEPPMLGRADAFVDWQARFTADLAERDWLPVIGEWLAVLMPGLSAAAAHGWLRVAHVAHALRSGATPARLDELASALAYWASCYERLPDDPHPSGPLAPSAALLAVPAHPDPTSFLISDALRGLIDEPRFAPAVDAVDPTALSAAAIVDAVAPLAVAGGLPIVYVHAITAPSAALLVSGLVDARTEARLTAYAWQTVAALVAAYPVPERGGPAANADADEHGAAPCIDDLVERALANGDEHAIKVVAAVAAATHAGASPVAARAAAVLVDGMRA
jgi:hypothetical protein